MTSLDRSLRSAPGHRPVVVPYADPPRMRVRRATLGGTPGGDLTMLTIQTREV